jgi:hypothetical protein
MPVDERPSAKGNLVLLPGDPPNMKLADEKDKKLLRPLYTSHFATCEHAGKWRMDS